jgi:hypothetical protein
MTVARLLLRLLGGGSELPGVSMLAGLGRRISARH